MSARLRGSASFKSVVIYVLTAVSGQEKAQEVMTLLKATLSGVAASKVPNMMMKRSNLVSAAP